jgi:hypothetical protein
MMEGDECTLRGVVLRVFEGDNEDLGDVLALGVVAWYSGRF